MKSFLKTIIVFCVLLPGILSAQTLDTTITIENGQKVPFRILKGKNPPILFESGFGNGGDVWNNLIKSVSKATDATIITYDRLSLGADTKNYIYGLEKEIIILEKCLDKLGYLNKEMMLVAHSLGGMYCSFFASRHAEKVKAAVFIDDANTCSLTYHFQRTKVSATDTIENYLSEIMNTVKNASLPKTIPMTDIVADTHFDDEGNPDTVWLECHKKFVAESPKRQLLLAYNVGHYVFIENPQLVINAIIQQYAGVMVISQKTKILEKWLALSTETFNEIKKNEVKCGHSEDDLTTWGYSLLENGQTEKAIEVFKLNVTMNPEGWNTYDSLGEAYLKAGNTELAIKNYKRSLELNPKNDNAIKVLKQIVK